VQPVANAGKIYTAYVTNQSELEGEKRAPMLSACKSALFLFAISRQIYGKGGAFTRQTKQGLPNMLA